MWNNFPLPLIDDEERQAIEEAGRAILEARSELPDLSLADHYRPGSMTPAVKAAHATLDRLVDRAFRLSEPEATTLQRQEVLFAHYEELTAPRLAATRKGQSPTPTSGRSAP